MGKLILFFLMVFSTSAFAQTTNYCTQAGACYLYNEGSGTSTTDNSGNGNTGTFSSSGHPAWSTSVPTFAVSGSPSFSTSYASGDYITYGTTNTVLQVGNPVTVTMWVYITAHGATGGELIGKQASTTSGVFFLVNVAGTDTFPELIVRGSTAMNREGGTSGIPLNAWTFLALTWDGSATDTNIHIYINNSEISYQNQQNGVSLASNAGNVISTGGDSFGNKPFVGLITNVGVFSSILSSTALTSIYNYGLQQSSPATTLGANITGVNITGATIN